MLRCASQSVIAVMDWQIGQVCWYRKKQVIILEIREYRRWRSALVTKWSDGQRVKKRLCRWVPVSVLSRTEPAKLKFATYLGIPEDFDIQDSALSTPEPTTAMPGTAAKVEVFARRYANGEKLFHPDDPTFLKVV